MKTIPEQLYTNIVRVSADVKEQLRLRGIIIPVKNINGSISLGLFTVIKNDDGFYSVKDNDDQFVVDNINLPQTAAMIANSLALGYYVDRALVQQDKNYGYALFEELLHKQAVERYRNKKSDSADIAMTKCLISRAKKDLYKKAIVRNFERLRKLA